VESSPAVANGVVYVGSDDGNVYAFGLTGAAGTEERSELPAPSSLKPDFSLRPSQAVGGGQNWCNNSSTVANSVSGSNGLRKIAAVAAVLGPVRIAQQFRDAGNSLRT
jgi:outer membrane protein assembly factor BamB